MEKKIKLEDATHVYIKPEGDRVRISIEWPDRAELLHVGCWEPVSGLKIADDAVSMTLNMKRNLATACLELYAVRKTGKSS